MTVSFANQIWVLSHEGIWIKKGVVEMTNVTIDILQPGGIEVGAQGKLILDASAENMCSPGGIHVEHRSQVTNSFSFSGQGFAVSNLRQRGCRLLQVGCIEIFEKPCQLVLVRSCYWKFFRRLVTKIIILSIKFHLSLGSVSCLKMGSVLRVFIITNKYIMHVSLHEQLHRLKFVTTRYKAIRTLSYMIYSKLVQQRCTKLK